MSDDYHDFINLIGAGWSAEVDAERIQQEKQAPIIAAETARKTEIRNRAEAANEIVYKPLTLMADNLAGKASKAAFRLAAGCAAFVLIVLVLILGALYAIFGG